MDRHRSTYDNRRSQVDDQNKIISYKLVLLGETAVGKTALVFQFVNGQFHDRTKATVGASFLTKTLDVDSTVIKFDIWDTAGQERFHSLAPMYYRGAQAAIVVYDITNQDSFEKAKVWIRELLRQASPNIVIALAGNKSDLVLERQVEYEDGKKYAEEHSILFMETSAKTAVNVNNIFLAISKKLPTSIENKKEKVKVLNVTADNQQKPKSSNCCK